VTFEEYTIHIDWSLTVGRRRTRQAASTVRELEGAPALLAALDDERAGSGEIRNARAVICLAKGDPAAALATVADVLHGSSPAANEQSSSPPVEELSPGELRVLRYLPTNLSRPEIAGELSVSPNTVSTHLRSIYAKLQVRDRSSAVQRARELRLLAAGRAR
jgi:DNA-binding NarL/FixJ family response regulator